MPPNAAVGVDFGVAAAVGVAATVGWALNYCNGILGAGSNNFYIGDSF